SGSCTTVAIFTTRLPLSRATVTPVAPLTTWQAVTRSLGAIATALPRAMVGAAPCSARTTHTAPCTLANTSCGDSACVLPAANTAAAARRERCRKRRLPMARVERGARGLSCRALHIVIPAERSECQATVFRCQAEADHGCPDLRMALAVVTSFLAMATRATLAGLPAARMALYSAL